MEQERIENVMFLEANKTEKGVKEFKNGHFSKIKR